MMSSEPYTGILSALPTPFHSEGHLDIEAFKSLVRWQRGGQGTTEDESKGESKGVSGFVVYGTTGESPTLTENEREILTMTCLEESGGLPVIAGVGTNSTRETIRRAKVAQAWGAHGGLIVTPYYNKPTQRGLYDHFSQVASAAPSWPLILYVVPARAGVTLEVETVQRLLTRHPNIVSIKDATSQMSYGASLIQVCEGRASVLSGDDPTCFPMWALGAQGSISVMSNLCPFQVRTMWDQMNRGAWLEAQRLFYDLYPLSRALFIESNPAPIKAALSWYHTGQFNPDVRAPLSLLSEGHLSELIKVCVDYYGQRSEG